MSLQSTGTIKSRQFKWEPETDITTFELARAVPIFFLSAAGCDISTPVDELPDEVRRHFTEV